MERYQTLKSDLLKCNHELIQLLGQAESIPGMSDPPYADWVKTCHRLDRNVAEEIVRVAVVGPIKSGKSTFANSLLGGDYLKRGAGVVTSIVTRVRTGEELKATLFFKSWDEVNADIAQALVLFPTPVTGEEREAFDIRHQAHRMSLQTALEQLSSDLLITDGTRNENSVLLSCYLKGYSTVKDVLASGNLTTRFENDRFAEHRAFVGNDALAVYLKDIQIDISGQDLAAGIEIADCQGSDSPNPLHLAMIQDYLLLAHFLVYVISSRTGLREADLKFLSIIKRMGIADSVIFVLNTDFSEHQTLEDLETLIGRVREELSLIKPHPEIYSLSALYNLFQGRVNGLPPKDRQRLEQWRAERDFINLSGRETARFTSAFRGKLTEERYALLLKNHLARLGVITSGLNHRAAFRRDLLSQDARGADAIIRKVQNHQKRMRQIQAMIKSTLDGAVRELKQRLKIDVDRQLNARSGKVARKTVEFIRSYQVNCQAQEENLRTSGFTHALYQVFQAFRHNLDTYLAETVNPAIVRFLKEAEEEIRTSLNTIVGPYDIMIQEALAEYNGTMSSFGMSRIRGGVRTVELADMEAIKTTAGLKLPPAAATMRYTARLKTEAVMQLGFFKAVVFLKKLLKKPQDGECEESILALKGGVRRMKQDTEKSVLFHFKNYGENLKFQYVLKLVDAAAAQLYEALMERFQAYVADLSTLIELIGKKGDERDRVFRTLEELEITTGSILEKIDGIRSEFETRAKGGDHHE